MENTNKEVIDEIKKGNEKLDLASKEIEKQKAETVRIEKEFKDKWDAEQVKFVAQGATLADLQEEVKELKAKGGKIITTDQTTVKQSQINLSNPEHVKGVIHQAIEASKADFMKFKAGKGANDNRIEFTKASPILSANLTGNPYFDYLPAAPGQRPFGQTRFRELAPTYQSDTDNVIYTVQGTAPNSGSFNYQSDGAAKAEVDYIWSNVSLVLRAFAGYAKVSRQALRNIPFLQSYLPMNLMEDLMDQEDLNFSATLYAGATGSTSNTGSSGSPIEDITIFLKNLLKKKYNPSGVAIDPDKWAEILLTKPGTTVTNYSLPAVASIDSVGMVRLLGKPLYPVNWLTGGKVIVGDWSRVGVIESEGLTLSQTDSDQDDFVKNLFTFRLERTENLAIFRTDAFIATTVS